MGCEFHMIESTQLRIAGAIYVASPVYLNVIIYLITPWSSRHFYSAYAENTKYIMSFPTAELITCNKESKVSLYQKTKQTESSQSRSLMYKWTSSSSNVVPSVLVDGISSTCRILCFTISCSASSSESQELSRSDDVCTA